MKVIALMNSRIGPNRVGPWGTLQSVFHGFKVLAKEDFTPIGADRSTFTIAPIVVFLSVVLTFLVVPFAPGLFGVDMNVGLLYFFAVGGLSVVGLLMGGWASFNKYSLLGGLRAAAQIVSYEIPLTLSVVGIVMLTGTMSLNRIVELQAGQFWSWNVFVQPLGFAIFFIAAAAEANRTPFDLTEADSEIVAGFSTEYSGMRFGFFYFAEYVTLFVMSGLTVVLFLGGWHAPIDTNEIAAFFGRYIPVVAIDPAALGVGLLLLIVLGPVIGTLLLAAPIAMLRTDWSIWKVLLVAFVLLNVVLGGLITLYLYAAFAVVAGVFWFFAKTFTLVFVFVWMRGTLPRVRVDQLMAFAWKWLLPASLVNIFVTAIAIVVLR
jgi:NADH:ubiquinone oxidoreductase subunit H